MAKTAAQLDREIALEIIRAHGGTVSHSAMSGWLGGVKGLRISDVRKLAAEGLLTVAQQAVVRRTRRSKALPITVTTYTLV